MTFPNTGPHQGAGSGRRSGTADHPDQKPSRQRSCCLGCLAVPLVGVLVLSVYATVQSFQSGRIVPFPELSASPEWTAEGLPGRSVGGWWSEERIVQVSEEGLTAVATDGGEELWRLEPDTRVCGLAEEPAEGVGVVLLDGDHEDPDPPSYEEDDPARSCDDVLAVDLDDGIELWRSGPLLESGLPGTRHREELDVSVHEDGAVVRVEGELLGFDLADGSRSWSHDELTADGASCPTADLTGRDGTHATVVADCGAGDQISVHTLDAGSGEDTTSFTFDRGPHETNDDLAPTLLLNSDPVMVHLDLGHRRGPERSHDPELTESGTDDPHWQQTLVFDGSGNLVTSVEGTRNALRNRDDEGPRLLFGEDRVHMSTSNYSCADELYTHDLSTGQELWETSMRGNGHRAVAVQDGRILTVRGGGPEEPQCTFLTSRRDWQFYVLDAGTGAAEPLTRQMHRYNQPHPDQVWWHGERVYFVDDSVGQPATVVAL